MLRKLEWTQIAWLPSGRECLANAQISKMKILVVRLSSLGDILHLFPAVSDLRRKFPNAEIHWLVEPAFAEAVAWHADVDKVTSVPLRAHKKIWWKIPVLLSKLRRRLQAEHYDVVLDAQGLIKSATLSRLAGVPVYGFDANSARESIASRLYEKTANVPNGLHVIEKNRQLVEQLFAANISQSADFGLDKFRAEQTQRELSDMLNLNGMTNLPCVVLLHGTTWTSKYWPEIHGMNLPGNSHNKAGDVWSRGGMKKNINALFESRRQGESRFGCCQNYR